MQVQSNNPTLRAVIEAMAPIEAAGLALSDEIWGHAETNYGEYKSAEAQASLLEANGFTVTRGLCGIPTAFVAEAGEGPGTVAFLGEFDALDGLSQDADVAVRGSATPGAAGHGCGHNLLGAASLLAAWGASRVLREKSLPGRVRYYGCPAEEGGWGKTFMVRAGCFDGVDFALSWHPFHINGALNSRTLAAISAIFRFFGTTAHAGLSPEIGRSALDAAELMSVGVNYMREHMPSECRVHYAYHDAGGRSANVVPGFAQVHYMIRAGDNAAARSLFQRVCKIAEGAALMTETTLQVEIDGATSNLVGNTPFLERLIDNMAALGPPDFDEADHEFAAAIQDTLRSQAGGGDDAASFGSARLPALCDRVLPVTGAEPLMHGSTDVGDVSWIVPTAQCFAACFAIGTPFHTWQMVAQGKAPAAHKGLLLAARSMAATGIDVLTDPVLADGVRADFRRPVAEGYENPIPADVIPPPLREVKHHIHAV